MTCLCPFTELLNQKELKASRRASGMCFSVSLSLVPPPWKDDEWEEIMDLLFLTLALLTVVLCVDSWDLWCGCWGEAGSCSTDGTATTTLLERINKAQQSCCAANKNPIQKLQLASQLIFQAAAILSRRKGWLSSDRGAGCVLQHSSGARQFAVSLCSAC